jgi:peptidylprolyl isomerase
VTKIIVFIVLVAALFWVVQRVTGTSKKDLETTIQVGAAFLQENRQREGVHTTDSGLQYQVLQTGTGTIHPTASDRVRVHYEGTLIDGTVFDSSISRGEPIDFGLNQVIAGWTEGVQRMVEGEKMRFFIPYDLAYGTRAAGKIPAGSTLIFEVELIKINP